MVRRTAAQLLLAAGMAVLCAGPEIASQGQAASIATFGIRIPPNVPPTTTHVFYTFAPSGQLPESVTIAAGTTDFSVPLAGTQFLKLLVFVPGYQMVATEFQGAQLDSTVPYTLPLKPLSTIPIDGLAVDSSNRPLPNYRLALSYKLLESAEYFCGMCTIDGSIPEIKLGEVQTDAAGKFRFGLPNLREDPFHQRYSRSGDGPFFVRNGGPAVAREPTLRPLLFSLQSAIDHELLVITRFEPGTLGGRVGANFLRQQGLGDLKFYRLASTAEVKQDGPPAIEIAASPVDQSTGLMARATMLQPDGTFELTLPAGVYDVNLLIRAAGEESVKRIPVATKVLIEEGQRAVVSRE